MSNYKQERILVTGGSKGLGKGVALSFAETGASIVVADVDVKSGKQCEKEIHDLGGKGLFVETDVSSNDQVEKLFEEAEKFLGGIDVLVNNAGIAHGPSSEKHFLEIDQTGWENLMNVNLLGLYLCSRLAVKSMLLQGEVGSIINVSSGGATQAHRNRVAYDATKGAIEAATRSLALDLAPRRIRVNAVMPGAMEVESRTSVGEESDPSDAIPLGRFGTPNDVGKAVLFLTSNEASYITGHVLVVDGGLTAQLRPPKLDADVEGPIKKFEKKILKK